VRLRKLLELMCSLSLITYEGASYGPRTRSSCSFKSMIDRLVFLLLRFLYTDRMGFRPSMSRCSTAGTSARSLLPRKMPSCAQKSLTLIPEPKIRLHSRNNPSRISFCRNGYVPGKDKLGQMQKNQGDRRIEDEGGGA
jgi:hypothetical protein